MNPELDVKLCDKYPAIFRDRHGDIQSSCMPWGFECGDGWYWLIDRLCGCVQSYTKANSRLNDIPQVVATQVKEKFGGLRFYYGGGDEVIGGMIWLAENMSYHICEQCGSTHNVTQSNGGWTYTRCEKCHTLKEGSDVSIN